MLSLAHTLISLPLGIYLDQPLLIVLAAFILHLVSDSFLHWNIYPHHFSRYPFFLVALDIGGGLLASWLLLGTTTLFSLAVIAAIAGGNLPDILHELWQLTPDTRKGYWPRWAQAFFRFHMRIQRETEHVITGLISQAIMIGVSITLLMLR